MSFQQTETLTGVSKLFHEARPINLRALFAHIRSSYAYETPIPPRRRSIINYPHVRHGTCSGG
jgi:hypothetical protein